MKNKMLCIIIFLLLISTTSFGQSSFQEITPGTSTRDDVARALGQPVRSISATLFEYKPPAGIARVEVEYGAGSPVVERIEVYFLRPISSSALMQKLDLKSSSIDLHKADARGKTSQGKIVEYFLRPMVAMTYQSAEASSGVSQIGYYSEGLFNKLFVEKVEKGEAQMVDITAEEQSKLPALTGGYGEIRGIVKVRTSDGSLRPVENAAVDFYRTDGLSGHFKARTNKYGHFVYHGLAQNGSWVVVASGPGMKWAYLAGVRTPLGGLEIVAEAGNGATPTWEEVKATIR